MLLNGKVALVTGASRGIGAATARLLAVITSYSIHYTKLYDPEIRYGPDRTFSTA